MKNLGAAALVASSALLVGSARPCGAQGLDPLAGPSLAPPAGPSLAKPFETKSLSLDGPPDDGRRTLGAFPKNLGRNFVGVFSGTNLVTFAYGAAATATAVALDESTGDLLQGSCPSCGSTGATAGGAAMVPFVGALFVAGRFAPQGRFRAATYDFAQAAIVTEAYTGLLKYTVRRDRPDTSDKLSFPSGHTSIAFTLAAVADRHYGWKVGVPAYVLASGIGLSRIESNRHHLSDVVAGATLGIIVGHTVTRLDGEHPAKKRIVSVGPATDAHGQGVGLGVSASW